MNMLKWMTGFTLMAAVVLGQHDHGEGACDCPSCREKAAKTFTLPGLEGLNTPEDACVEDHDHAEHVEQTLLSADADHAGHDHAEHVEQTLLSADADHAGHDHAAEAAGQDDHSACGGHDDPSACGGHDEHAEEGGLAIAAQTAEKIGLQIRRAQGGVLEQSAVFPAEILLNRDRAAAVSPRYAGEIRQVFAEIGDPVRKGDVLASLENRETLSVYTVKAPLDGVVVAKDASVGEFAAEERILFEVADLSSVWADISIFPTHQHLVRKGMAVKFIAHDGHAAEGTVHYVSPLVSHETRTFTARCVLEGAAEDFTPGAFVRARIVTTSEPVRVRVERDAVQRLDGEPVVFLADEHGFETRVVQTGRSNDRFVEIISGLNPGERYVSAGAFALKAEMLTSGMDPHAGHGH